MLSYRKYPSPRSPLSCGPVAVFTPKHDTGQEVCPVSKKGMEPHYPIRRDPGGGLYRCALSCGPAITPQQAETLFTEGELQLPDGHLEICGEITARRIIETNQALEHLKYLDLIKKVEDLLTEDVFNDSLTQADVWEFLNSCTLFHIDCLRLDLEEAYEISGDTASAIRRALRLFMESHS